MLQNDAIITIWSLLLNGFFSTVKLLDVEICIDCLVILQKFVKNDVLAIHHTQHCLTRMMIFVFLVYRDCFFVFYVTVKEPFFIASNMIISVLVTSNKIDHNRETLKLVAFA